MFSRVCLSWRLRARLAAVQASWLWIALNSAIRQARANVCLKRSWCSKLPPGGHQDRQRQPPPGGGGGEERGASVCWLVSAGTSIILSTQHPHSKHTPCKLTPSHHSRVKLGRPGVVSCEQGRGQGRAGAWQPGSRGEICLFGALMQVLVPYSLWQGPPNDQV